MKKYCLYLGLTQNNGMNIDRHTVILWLSVQLKNHQIKEATFTSALGFWEGKLEETLILSVNSEKDLTSIFGLFANIYKHDFKQDAVLYETNIIETKLF